MQKLRLLLPSLLVLGGVAELRSNSSAPHALRARAGLAAQPAMDLTELQWLAGTWRDQDGDSILEETWGVPLGNSMIGMFRWLGSGQPTLYELFAVELEDGRAVFRIRHFHRALRPWDAELEGIESFPLTESGPTKAVFENPEAQDVRRFVYERKDDVLHVRVELVEGEPYAFEFQRVSKAEDARAEPSGGKSH